jgi:hypothetical protein
MIKDKLVQTICSKNAAFKCLKESVHLATFKNLIAEPDEPVLFS